MLANRETGFEDRKNTEVEGYPFRKPNETVPFNQESILLCGLFGLHGSFIEQRSTSFGPIEKKFNY